MIVHLKRGYVLFREGMKGYLRNGMTDYFKNEMIGYIKDYNLPPRWFSVFSTENSNLLRC